MNTKDNNLSNYIHALELALKTAKEGADKLVDKDKVFKDIENCTKMAQFLFSDEKFPYEYSDKVSSDAPGIMQIRKVEDDVFLFVLDRLLPHRLDYHKLQYKTAAKINQSYAKRFERDVFEFIDSDSFKRYNDREKVCVVFINYYNPADKSVWDVDNLDVKIFIDYVVSGKFIKDDSHERLSYCMLTKKGDCTHTEVYLAPQDKLDGILKLI